jgi:TnpA family transposase
VVDDVPALTRDRLAHVDQHYLRPDNYAAANAVLINAQAEIALARAWGGGMVAAVDGVRFVPVLADLPDAKLWRINRGADYAALNRAARGQIDLEKIARHWPDILRVICSIYTRTISANDVIRLLQRGGRPTQLGEAIAM